MKTRLIISTALVATVSSLIAYQVYAHCQVPCGIFDESAEIKKLYQNVDTIEKAMKEMAKLADKDDAQSKQQFVRWVTTKESHAAATMTSIAEYFLAQRVKPAFNDDGSPTIGYLQSLAEHHAVMIAAMKCKQSADPATAKTLRNTIHALEHRWVPAHTH
jgi:nickel superoxide dismutase